MSASPYYQHAAVPMKNVASWPGRAYGRNFSSRVSNSSLGAFADTLKETVTNNPILVVGAIAAALMIFKKR